MVYESDFYTTRRPYSRPTITSYSVTRREVPWHLVPTVPRPSQVPAPFTVWGTRRTPLSMDGAVTIPRVPYHQQHIPYIAHKKLAMVTPSAHGWRVNKSVLLGEIDRIYHKVRPSLAYQPTEDYLNSRAIVSFDDETRSIRAQTADLLKKIYTPIPRSQRPLPLAGELLDVYSKIKNLTMRLVVYPRYLDTHGAYYSHSELPITERITSDHYIDRLLAPNRDVHHNVLMLSYYDEPAKRYSGIGKGHLACVSFAGGRPIARRRQLIAPHHDNIRNDITVLSHYGRFRAAAAAANVPEPGYIPMVYHPPTKSAVTGSWKSNALHRTPSDRSDRSKDSYRPRELTAGAEFDATQERKKKRREAIEAAALKESQEEKRRKQEAEMQEKLAELSAQHKEEEERREREEEEKRRREEEERLEREEEERKAKEEAERKAKEEAERKAREEAERKAKEEAERKAREEEERKAREEAERLAKEEAERKAKEEAERLAREEEERKAKEEADRLAREEEERKAKEEADRLAREEEERKAKEEADRLAKEEEERLAKEEADRLAKEAEAAGAGEEVVEEAPAEDEPAEVESAPVEEPVVEEPAAPEESPAAAAEEEEPAGPGEEGQAETAEEEAAEEDEEEE